MEAIFLAAPPPLALLDAQHQRSAQYTVAREEVECRTHVFITLKHEHGLRVFLGGISELRAPQRPSRQETADSLALKERQ